MLLVLGVSLALELRKDDRYSASTQILISSADPQKTIGDVGAAGVNETERVVRTLALARVGELAERVVRRADAGVSEGVFLRNATADIPEDSHTMTLTVRHSDATVAAKLNEAYAFEFLRYREEVRASLARAQRAIRARIARLDAANARLSPLYSSLVARSERLDANAAAHAAATTIIGQSRRATKTQPDGKRAALIGLGLGLFLGLGFAFARDATDSRVRRTETAGRLVGLPLLGRVPRLRGSGVATLDDPDGTLAEAFRLLRASVDLAARPVTARTVMVTSAVEGEGAPAAAANLAAAFAQAGRRVVLVDADLRDPAAAGLFGVPAQPGVREVAEGRATLGQALARVPTAEGRLEVLPAGERPARPGDFVHGDALGELLRQVREHADLVVVQGPPVIGLGDALELSTHVDALVLVVSLRRTRQPMLREVGRILSATSAAKLGFVATDADLDDEYYEAGYRRRLLRPRTARANPAEGEPREAAERA